MLKPIRAVLLDVDGTLVDSNDAHARAWVEALAEAGVEAPFEQVRELIGMGGDKLMPRVSGIREDSPEGKRLADRRQAIFKSRYLPHLEPFPRVRELIDRLKAAGFKLVVATSAGEDELEGLLRVADAADLVPTATSSDDADRSKPDPDIVEAAVARAGYPVEQVLLIGDTPYDIEAAMRAGVGAIALRTGGWDDTALERAVAIYDDPADLLAHFDDSPLMRRGLAKRHTP